VSANLNEVAQKHIYEPTTKTMKINQLCKFISFHLGSWLVFIWEVGSFTTFAPSSVLLTSPHIIEVVREAIRNKIYRNIDVMLQDIADLKSEE
jgi:hypothetical protein